MCRKYAGCANISLLWFRARQLEDEDSESQLKYSDGYIDLLADGDDDGEEEEKPHLFRTRQEGDFADYY